MKTDVFPLSNLVLYAKGWYATSDDVWEDLKKILILDDYMPFSKGDVLSIIVSKFQDLNCRQSELKQVLSGIQEYNCWKYNYFTKKGNIAFTKGSNIVLVDYNMETAFIYYVLSALRDLDNKQWIPITPRWTKFPKRKDITIRKVYEMFVLKK